MESNIWRPGREAEETEIARPHAGALIQSLRAFGYDPATAIADLIDNSITAGAKNIWLEFRWDGPASKVVLIDDGHGMSEEEIREAMRPGSQNPLSDRSSHDLGRFGLGMKTASFSQCRCLTVASRRRGEMVATRCWDLNYVTACDEWKLLKPGPAVTYEFFSPLAPDKAGTVILWEDMDRLVEGTQADSERDQNRFLEQIERVKRHIAIVFHRFLDRPNPMRIWLQSRPIVPWDPFLRNEDATQELTEELHYFNGEKVVVRPYVLPHHSRLSPEARVSGAGPRGWHSQQGFYVYRNDRLLVDGDWLGLGFQKLPHHDLARICVDFPTTLDSDWHIDVKKSRARPPAALRDHLKRVARLTQERAADAYRHRGKVYARRQGKPDEGAIWVRKIQDGKTSYVVNRGHSLVQAVVSGTAPQGAASALLRLLEELMPIPHIVIDSAEHPTQHSAPFEFSPNPEVHEILQQIFHSLCAQGYTDREARERLMQMEYFNRHPQMIETLTLPE